MLKRDLVLLLPCVALCGFLLHGLNEFTGASDDLVVRVYAMFGVAWAMAWPVSSSVLSIPAIRRLDFSHFTRCLLTVILFWPLMGLCVAASEDWTIAYRQDTWDSPTDLGWNYLY